jgi:hypothetical protein
MVNAKDSLFPIGKFFYPLALGYGNCRGGDNLSESDNRPQDYVTIGYYPTSSRGCSEFGTNGHRSGA